MSGKAYDRWTPERRCGRPESRGMRASPIAALALIGIAIVAVWAWAWWTTASIPGWSSLPGTSGALAWRRRRAAMGDAHATRDARLLRRRDPAPAT